jgi:hypothetical protein
MKAWIFRDPRQNQKLGAKCPWSVGWIDPNGEAASKGGVLSGNLRAGRTGPAQW